jgi:N-carbamoyl-L-amino-acid hydrolase
LTGQLNIQPGRLEQDLQALADYGREGKTAVTRLAFTNEDNEAYQFVESLMKDAGLETRYDAFGNLFGRRKGITFDALPVLTGSHIDGPPNGGMYDGTVGVLAGIEACRALDDGRIETTRPVEVVAVRCEHLDRFGLSCLGSRALGGKLTVEDLKRLKDEDSVSLHEAISSAGFSPDRLETVALRGNVHAWLELHIEQGRVLEDAESRIGVITGIAGPTRYRVQLEGLADHSGGTPMSIRRDALCGAADIALLLERLSRKAKDCVGTIGILNVRPGAVHTIPGQVEFYVDIRGTSADTKNSLVRTFRASMQERAIGRGLQICVEDLVDEDPVPCSQWIIDVLCDVCQENGLSYEVMPSGGGHDSQHIAAATDVGMLFVPSVAGISHTPDEYTSIEDICLGTEVLTRSLLRVAGEQSAI